MTCRNVSAGDIDWNFCPEATPREADRSRAIVRARFIDELTGLPMRSNLTINTRTLGLRPSISDGGVGGLSANPLRRFPGLAATTVGIDMHVQASRYLPRDFDIDLGPIVNYPNAFAAHDLGDVAMHRAATMLRGHVVRESGITRVPLVGATVRIIGIWPEFPAANDDQPLTMQAPDICAFAPGLYANRQAAVDTVTARVLDPAVGQEKALLRPSVIGDVNVRLSNREILLVGDVLALEPGHPDRAEFISIQDIQGASTADQPATITLVHACRQDHPEGSVAVRVTPLAAATPNDFTRNAIPGDRTAFLNVLTGLAGAVTVEIAGTGDVEYQRVGLYDTVAAIEGAWRFPLLSRVAQIRIEADRIDQPQPLALNISPDYDRAEFRTDLVFPSP